MKDPWTVLAESEKPRYLQTMTLWAISKGWINEARKKYGAAGPPVLAALGYLDGEALTPKGREVLRDGLKWLESEIRPRVQAALPAPAREG